MTTAPKRRWFRYSLRTLSVVVTVFACWFAWNVKLIRERTAMRQEIEQEAFVRFSIVTGLGVPSNFEDYWKVDVLTRGQPEPVHIPLIRRLFGDKQGPYLIKRNNREKALESVRLFPESDVRYCLGAADVVPQQYRDIMDVALQYLP